MIRQITDKDIGRTVTITKSAPTFNVERSWKGKIVASGARTFKVEYDDRIHSFTQILGRLWGHSNAWWPTKVTEVL